MKKLVKESLRDSLFEKMEVDTIVVTVRKGSGENLVKILDCIKGVGNIGHSFSVVVDPDEKEKLSERTFGWDGDGSDYIDSIELKKG